MLDQRVLLIVVIASLGIFYSCVCRLKMTHQGVFLRVRNRYVLIGGGSLFSAFGSWIFPWYGGELYGMAIFIVSIALGFWLDRKDWEHGIPPTATTEPGELHEATRK